MRNDESKHEFDGIFPISMFALLHFEKCILVILPII